MCQILSGESVGENILLVGATYERKRMSCFSPTFIHSTELFELAHWRDNAHNILPAFQLFKFAVDLWFSVFVSSFELCSMSEYVRYSHPFVLFCWISRRNLTMSSNPKAGRLLR